MDKLPERFIHEFTEQIAMLAVDLGYEFPFHISLKDSAEYALVIKVEKAGPQIVAQVATADRFRFPVHAMVSDLTGKPAAYAVLDVNRSKPKLRIVK